jgi:hypothetical protein
MQLPAGKSRDVSRFERVAIPAPLSGPADVVPEAQPAPA